MDPSDYLLGVRDVMRERGMCRNALEDGGGRVCLTGAFNLFGSNGETALTESYVNPPPGAWCALRDECWRRYGTPLPHDANNDHIRDLDEACDVLEAAAKRAAGEGS